MGQTYEANCDKCGHKFKLNMGGGFFFHLLKCDKCGKDKDISFEEIGEPHLRYLKGLGGPYCVATTEHDEYIRKHYPGEPLSEEEYHLEVEKIAGKCKCGGHYKFDAPPRCPKCRSEDITKESRPHIFYD